KWKIHQTDGMGNLIRVLEPDPASGPDLVTNYTYNGADQLTQVSMPRSTGTQTRTFVYNGADLITATNPENGTVTYTYDGSHRMLTKTDAKGQQIRYEYHDVSPRMIVKRCFTLVNGQLQEQTGQQVTFYYDTPVFDDPPTGLNAQNTAGRLATVAFRDSLGYL